MKVDVKICGLDREESVDAAARAGARMLGFVFYSKSPRNLTPSKAFNLISRVPKGVERVGLFVNPTNQKISQVLEKNKLDFIQLHGTETPERINEIRAKIGLPIIKVVKISDSKDLKFIRCYEDVSDWLLFDAVPPESMENSLPGGNSVSFDWKILAGVKIHKPWILAGGLTKSNVKIAIDTSRTRVVDVSSGVEERPGFKSLEKIKAFIDATRAS